MKNGAISDDLPVNWLIFEPKEQDSVALEHESKSCELFTVNGVVNVVNYVVNSEQRTHNTTC